VVLLLVVVLFLLVVLLHFQVVLSHLLVAEVVAEGLVDAAVAAEVAVPEVSLVSSTELSVVFVQWWLLLLSPFFGASGA